MARTPLFSYFKRALQLAACAEARGWSASQLDDVLGTKAELKSRRAFLKSTALLAMTPYVPNFSALSFAQSDLKPSSERVLILGAGAAGLAAAYTLSKANVPFKILEASGRIGGRIYTQTRFNEEQQFIERGAELVDSNHQTLIGLARELDLEIESFAPGDAGLEPQLFYCGGKYYRDAELTLAAAPLVRAVLKAQAAGAEPVTYYDAKAKKKAAKWDHMSLAEFLGSLKNDVDEWVLKGVGVAYVGELGLEIDEQSALGFLTLVGTTVSDRFELFGASDESRRVKGGSQRLTDALAAASIRRGGSIETGAKVVALSKRAHKIIVSIEQDGKTHEEFASQVICTLPFSVLREVDGLDQLGLSAVKLDGIRNWGFGTNSKIMLETKTRPWRENGHAAPASSGSIYSDCASQAFWETTRMQGGTHGILSNFLGGKAGAVADRDTITRLALPDLARIHPGIENQFVKGVVHNWLKVPTARGSYSCLRPGQYLRFFGAGGEAELGGQLLFAGEQASIESSGYMNGAFETGIDAANKAIKALLMICRNSA